MLALAVIAAVAAVGTFLDWAITRGYLTLTPGIRVALGLVFAAAIGAWGIKLRRTERPFGSSLLGLALVIVLVCGYAAGPGLHLVPAWLAFAGSAGVSWGLALFARVENDEPLWCVAFGGATLAPFVTSNGMGNLYALVAYGLVLSVSACFAIAHRPWPVAWRVFYAVTALFGAASADRATRGDTAEFFAVFLLPQVISLSGVLPFAPASRKRGVMRWLAFITLAIAAFVGLPIGSWAIGLAAFGAAVLWLVLVDGMDTVPQSTMADIALGDEARLHWIDVAAIPFGLVFVAANTGSDELTPWMVMSAASVLFVVFAWRRAIGAPRDAAACGAVLVAVDALMRLPIESTTVKIAGLLALALATLALHRARPSRSWLIAGGGVLLLAAGVTVASLADRSRYVDTPFLTEPSLAALAVTVTLVVVARFWRWVFDATRTAMAPRTLRMYADEMRLILDGTVAAPWVWVFAWVLIELAMTVSARTSTMLLVTYFAATAVACVAAGRARRSAIVRQTGLALAVAAAATAVYGSTMYFDSVLRVVAYLVISPFLLGIAYWYRRPGSGTSNG